MNRVILSAALEGVRDEYIQEAAAPHRLRPAVRRIVAAAVAAALCLMLALPALAASEEGYELMYAVAPSLAQRFKPVQLSCEDNGIEMEVVAAYVHGDTAEAFVSLRDLTGDRVDETTDLFDSYRINLPFDSISTCRLESFDESTGTALFYIAVSRMDGRDIQADKLTFSVREFLSRKQTVEGYDLSAVLSDMPAAPETRTDMPIRGGNGLGIGFSEPPIPCLIPRDVPLLAPANGVAVTGAGYVNGQLHIQVHYEDVVHTDNHGFLYVVGPDGAMGHSLLSLSFWDEAQTGSYQEYIFDLPESELSHYTFYGDFYTCDQLTEGSWQVTFPLE